MIHEAIQPCAPADRRRDPIGHSLNARLFALDELSRTRALTDRESEELERLLNAKAQRDVRKIVSKGGKPKMDRQPIRQTFGGGPVRAMEDAMAERQRQITEFGHTPEADLQAWHDGQDDKIARTAARYGKDAAESMGYGRNQLHVARIKSIKAIAAHLANVDLIDALLAEEEEPKF